MSIVQSRPLYYHTVLPSVAVIICMHFRQCAASPRCRLKRNMAAALLMRVAAVFTVLLCVATVAHGFAVRVDAHEEECFHDTVESGTRVRLGFQVRRPSPPFLFLVLACVPSCSLYRTLAPPQVVEGGFLDIDVKVWCGGLGAALWWLPAYRCARS